MDLSHNDNRMLFIILDTLNTNDENMNVLTAIPSVVVTSTIVNCIIATVIPEKNATMSLVFCIIWVALLLSFEATLGSSNRLF